MQGKKGNDAILNPFVNLANKNENHVHLFNSWVRLNVSIISWILWKIEWKESDDKTNS